MTKKTDPSNEQSWDTFRERLENNHEFPCCYVFKFIVPRTQLSKLSVLFDQITQRRESQNGKYIAITLEQDVTCVEEVVMVYQKAAAVPGIISL